jgi:hypothetical protein
MLQNNERNADGNCTKVAAIDLNRHGGSVNRLYLISRTPMPNSN